MTDKLKIEQQQAKALLDRFSGYAAGYKHGVNNPYLKWLLTNPVLTIKQVVNFLCFWYPVSRHQPQMLLQLMALFPRWNDRKKVFWNWVEEDGMGQGQEPHYYLLQQLIHKLDNNFKVDYKVVKDDGLVEINDKYKGDNQANEVVTKFHDTLYKKMSSAEVSGLIAAIEQPALDISAYFNKLVELCGRPDLLKSDLYLLIHCEVEPAHIVWSHGTAEQYMKNGKKAEVVNSFYNTMQFWNEFWKIAFTKLGYPG
jgi:hypothetical protein